jgi:YD repeat-containing protein
VSRIAAHARVVVKIFSTAFAVALACCFLPYAAHAQVVSSATDGKTPSGLSPGAPAGSYPLSGFENINPYNGNLNFRLPLLGVGGRGDARTAVTLAIDAKKWRVEHHVTTHPDTGVELDSYAPKPNWWTGIEPGYGPGVLQGRQVGEGARSCSSDPFYRWYFYSTLTRLTFTAGDGTEYELRDQLTGGQPAAVSNPCAQGASRGAVFVTADGTSATFVSDAVIYDTNKGAMSRPTNIYPSGFLMLRDGTRYRIDGGRVTWLRDRNGNRVSFAYTQGRVTTITDSLGRQVTVVYDLTDVAPYTFYDEITYTGFGGATRTVRVRKGTLGNSFRPNSGYSLQTYKGLFPELNNASTAT